jgi:drug/metabolite transporter (DMT)-like permease
MSWGGLAVGGILLLAGGFSGALPLHTAFGDVTLLGRQVAWIVPILGLSLIATVLAYVAGIAAVRALGSRLASFVGLSEVMFAVVFAWLLLGQRLDTMQLAGGVLVVAGIAFVRLDEIRLRGAPAGPSGALRDIAAERAPARDLPAAER